MNNYKQSSYSSLLTRRSIRKFEKTPVNIEIIHEIIRAGMYAPSPVDRQPWEFLIITNSELLDELAKASPHCRILKRVTVAIIVLLVNVKCSNPDAILQYDQACAAASENILIAATGQGLGAVWLGVSPIEDRVIHFRKVLNLPEDIIPFSAIPIGYAAEKTEPKTFFDDSKVHYNTYKI